MLFRSPLWGVSCGENLSATPSSGVCRRENLSTAPLWGASCTENLSTTRLSGSVSRTIFSVCMDGRSSFWGVGESTFSLQRMVVRRSSEETNSKHSGNTGTATHDASRLEPMTLPVPKRSPAAACAPTGLLLVAPIGISDDLEDTVTRKPAAAPPRTISRPFGNGTFLSWNSRRVGSPTR